MDFKIGADPELGFIKDGNAINAGSVMEEGSVTATFGLDGSHDVAEIRPRPNVSPAKVVRNIKNAMLDSVVEDENLLNYEWTAGSAVADYYPIGGHIHFGIKDITTRYGDLAAVLDNYLAPITVLLDDEISSKFRRNGSYGHLSDMRPQNWGPEYRTLSSWLTAPEIAEGVLSLAKALVYQEIAYPSQLAKTRFPNLETYFYASNKTKLKEIYNKYIKVEIPKLDLFKIHEEEIMFILTLVDKNKFWFPKYGLLDAWGIKESVEEVKIKEPLKAKNIEEL